MTTCSRCGKKLPGHIRYCPYCGTAVSQLVAPRRWWGWQVWGMLLVMLALLSGGGWMLWSQSQQGQGSLAAPLATPTPQDIPTPAPIPTSTPLPSFLESTPVPQPVAAISPENTDRVSQLARWGNGKVDEVTFSPGGHLLAVASSLGIYLYDAQTLAGVRFIETDAWVRSEAFSPDGKVLASGSSDGTVQLWRVSDGTLLRTLKGHKFEVKSVAFSPDGTMLASGLPDGTSLWRVSDGTLLRTLEQKTGSESSIAFSPDGTVLASAGSFDNTVRLWRVSDGALLRILEGHTAPVQSVAFSPNGLTLASGANDNTVQLWRVDYGLLLHTLHPLERAVGPGWPVWSVAFSPDGKILASGAADHAVRLWRVDDGALLCTLKGHTDWMRSVAFSPDGKILASGSSDGTVRLWGVH